MAVSSVPIAVGWLNQNSLRSYPFHEGVGLHPNDSTGALVEGGWMLPDCLVVDMSISVPGSGPDPFLYLSRMSVISGAVSLSFSDRDGNVVFTLAVDSSSHVTNTAYQIAGVGSFAGSRGSVCIGDLGKFLDSTPEGLYSFSPDETYVEPTCIRPSAECVRSIRASDADGYTSVGLVGDVSLIAGSNVRIDCDVANNAIWISADPNSGYSEDCDCGSGQAKCIRTIN